MGYGLLLLASQASQGYGTFRCFLGDLSGNLKVKFNGGFKKYSRSNYLEELVELVINCINKLTILVCTNQFFLTDVQIHNVDAVYLYWSTSFTICPESLSKYLAQGQYHIHLFNIPRIQAVSGCSGMPLNIHQFAKSEMLFCVPNFKPNFAFLVVGKKKLFFQTSFSK